MHNNKDQKELSSINNSTTKNRKTDDQMTKQVSTVNQHGRGGKRRGSGRPSGTGKYGEPTKAIRVPEGSITHIKSFLKDDYPTLNTEKASDTHHSSVNIEKISTLNSKNKQTVKGNKRNVTLLKTAHDWTNSDPKESTQIPLYSTKVAAGIPTMSDDHLEDSLDLNEYLVERPQTTFMLKVEGESMKDIGILPDDILIVDRAEKARHNKIVIAALDGELTVKRLYRKAGDLKLLPENPDYPEIEIRRESDLVIWGVVIGSFRRFQKNSFF